MLAGFFAHFFVPFFIPCLGAFLYIFLFLGTAMASSPHAKASLTFSYAKGIDGEDAATIVSSLVYEKALQQAYASLAPQRVLAFAMPEKMVQMALVSELFTEQFRVEGGTQMGSGTVTVSIELMPKHSLALENTVGLLLPQQNLLAMRLEWLRALKQHAALGKEFLLRASGIKADAPTAEYGSFSSLHEEAAKISRYLQALWIFDTALDHFTEIWQQPQEVARLMRQALQLSPHTPLFWACLGEAQLSMDDAQGAVQSLHKALHLQPMRGRALYIRALAYLRLEQPSLASIDLSAALVVEPENATWLEARGAAHSLLDEENAMCQDFAKACALGQCGGLQNARKKQLCLPEYYIKLTK